MEEKATQRAAEVLINDEQSPEDAAQNPPLSAVFDLWRTERNPSMKSWLEFRRALDAFVEVCGDLPVRSIKRDHIRQVKAALLQSTSKRDGKPIKPATARKLLATLGAVLSWPTREGYIENNPAAGGVARVAALEAKGLVGEERGRMPFTVEEVRHILSKLPEHAQDTINLADVVWPEPS